MKRAHDTPTTSESSDSENENVGNTELNKTRQFNLRGRILRSKAGSCVKYIKHSVMTNSKANRSHADVANSGQPRASISGVVKPLQKKAKESHSAVTNESGAGSSHTSQVNCSTSAASSASLNHFVQPVVVAETEKPTINDIAEKTTDEPQAKNAEMSPAKNSSVCNSAVANRSEDLFDDSIGIENGEPAIDSVINHIPTAKNENDNEIQDIHTNDENPTEPTSSIVIPIGNGVIGQSICNHDVDKTTDESQAKNAEMSPEKNSNVSNSAIANRSEDLFDDSIGIEKGEPAIDSVINNIPTAKNENENQIEDINTNDENPTEPTSSIVIPIGNGMVDQSICNDDADKTINKVNTNNGIVAKSIDRVVDAEAKEPAYIENATATDNTNELIHAPGNNALTLNVPTMLSVEPNVIVKTEQPIIANDTPIEIINQNPIEAANIKVETSILAGAIATEEIIEISDEEECVKNIKREPNESVNQTLLQRVALLEVENRNLRIHCEALQVRVRNSWNPLASSTLASTQSYEADKENLEDQSNIE